QALEHLIELTRETGDLEEVGRLQRRKAEVDRAKDWVHKLVVRLIAFRERPAELAERMAILGRSFDHHAWSLLAASAAAAPPTMSAGPTRRPGPDPDLARSRATCRALADAALARLLRGSGDARPETADSLADRLGDLRSALVADRVPPADSGDRDPA